MTVDVMVFAPTSLLTATIERDDADSLHIHAGGQGVWQARMVALLGGRPLFCTVVGGEPGRVLEPLLVEEGFEIRAVYRATATGWYVHDRRSGKRNVVAEGYGEALGRHDLDELYNIALAEGLRAPVSIISGPAGPDLVPADVYRRLTADLTANGGRIVADVAGEFLSAVLAGGVAMVKVSHEEVVAAGRADDESIPSLVAAARQLRADGAGSVVISRAEQPAIALLDDEPMLVMPPVIEEVDPRGTGDSMTAGMATMLARGSDLETAVRVGAAAGAVNVTRHGLGTGHANAIAELATRVTLRPLSGDW
jgi:1-phosphofructokinase